MTIDAVPQGELSSAAQQGAAAVVGSWLRDRRMKDGWTLAGLAAQASMDPERLQQIEAGAERMSVDELMAFAGLFKVPVSSFFDSASPTQPPEASPARTPRSPSVETRPETRPEAQDGGHLDDLALAGEVLAKFARIGSHALRHALVGLLSASTRPD